MRYGKFIGRGGEKIVYDDDQNESGMFLDRKPEKVYAEIGNEKETINLVKGRYYFAKVLQFLVPGLYPKMDLAGKHKDGRAYFRAEKVSRDLSHRFLNYTDRYKEKNKELPTVLQKLYSIVKFNRDIEIYFSNFVDASEAIGAPTDSYASNFTKQNGKIMSVDLPPPWNYYYKDGKIEGVDLAFDQQIIESAIGKLDEGTREQCLNCWKKVLEFLEKDKEYIKNQKSNEK